MFNRRFNVHRNGNRSTNQIRSLHVCRSECMHRWKDNVLSSLFFFTCASSCQFRSYACYYDYIHQLVVVEQLPIDIYTHGTICWWEGKTSFWEFDFWKKNNKNSDWIFELLIDHILFFSSSSEIIRQLFLTVRYIFFRLRFLDNMINIDSIRMCFRR